MKPILPVLRPLQFRSPGDVLLFKKRLKALPKNPVDAYLDWIYLPDPATIRLPFSLTNQQGGDRYVQTQLSSPPSGWTDSPVQHGAVANGATLQANHVTQRSMPSFTDGEYDETITLLVQLYKDSGYTELDLELTVEYALHHFKSDDPTWNLLAFHDFESDTEGHCSPAYTDSKWDYCSTYIKIDPPGYASNYSLHNTYTSTYLDEDVDRGQVWSCSFDSPSEEIGNALEQKWFDTMQIGLADTWLAFFGAVKDLSKAYFDLYLVFGFYTAEGRLAGIIKGNGYSMPSATKLYFSGLCQFYTGDSHWHFDRIRIVYK